MPAAIGFVFLCDLRDSARVKNPHKPPFGTFTNEG